MNTLAPTLVLLTSEHTYEARSHRPPLIQIVLPAQLFDDPIVEHFLRSECWWLEHKRERFYLRARLAMAQVSLQSLLRTQERHTVCLLDSSVSERITWPGTHKHSLEGFLSQKDQERLMCAGDIALLELSPALQRQFEEFANRVSPIEFNLELARRAVSRMLRGVNIPFDTFLGVRRYFRLHFSREELPRISGYDAFDVAAAIYLGLPQIPSAQIDDAGNEFEGWHELLGDEISYVQKIRGVQDQWESNLSAEESSERHQGILKLLVNELNQAGYTVFSNRFIDASIAQDQVPVLFEVKTSSPDTFLTQNRLAIGQLLEYRFRYADDFGREAKLVVVIESDTRRCRVDFARDFVRSLGIDLVVWDSDDELFYGLDDIIKGKL